MVRIAFDLASIPADQRANVEAWLQEFADHWSPSAFAQAVGRMPFRGQELRAAILKLLVPLDQRFSVCAGEWRLLESYLQYLPELGTPQTVAFELVAAEFALQRACGTPNWQQLAERFPQFAHRAEQAQAMPLPELTGSGTRLLDSAPPKNPTLANSAPDKSMDLEFKVSAMPPSPGAQPPKLPGFPSDIGKYQLIRELGRGGMGTVFLAQDTQLQRRVAVKLPSFGAETPEHFKVRFLQEARLAARIRHPNVCPVYDAGECLGTYYFVMAYIEGQPLSSLLSGSRPLDRLRLVKLLRDLARGLQVLHDHGIVHRDLKPANVMIDVSGDPLLTDFGLAYRAEGDAITSTGLLLGTPAYMAPEQIRGESSRAGPGGDIYSLGVIMYESIAREIPFRGKLTEILTQIVEGPLPRLRDVVPDIDPDLAKICEKAMARRVGDRYPTAADFARALDTYLRQAEPVALAARRAAKAANRLAMWPFVAVAATLFVLSAAVTWFFRGEPISAPRAEPELAAQWEVVPKAEPTPD